MKDQETFEKVLKIIKPYVKNESAFKAASRSTQFIQDLKINSARLVDIILSFEDEFNLTISDDEAEKISNLGDALDLISQKLSCAKK